MSLKYYGFGVSYTRSMVPSTPPRRRFSTPVTPRITPRMKPWLRGKAHSSGASCCAPASEPCSASTRNPYGLFDVYAAYTRSRIHPFLQLTNITNTVYQEVAGVAMPKRAVLEASN